MSQHDAEPKPPASEAVLHVTRSSDVVAIDAQAERDQDGRWHVRIAVIDTTQAAEDQRGLAYDGVISSEPWYEDTLDELTVGDLETLADEALAAQS